MAAEYISIGPTIFNWSSSVQLTAPPTYNAVITERKIVVAVILVNFYYRLIGEKKGQGESAVIPAGCRYSPSCYIWTGLYFDGFFN